jgi:hypothetical protein
MQSDFNIIQQIYPVSFQEMQALRGATLTAQQLRI